MNDSDRPSDPRFPLTNNSAGAQTGNAAPARTPSRRPPPARPHPFWTFLKWTSATFVCMTALAAGTFLGIINQNKFGGTVIKSFGTINGIKGILRGDPLAGFQPDIQMPPDKQHIINVLLLGCDSDYEDTRPVAIKGANGRSDSMMMARIDFDAKTINVLSIPRDTAVRIPGHGIQKINAAYAIGGADLTKATVKDVFGLDTDYYVRLDFDSFQKVVDAIGGVDLTVHKKLDYDDNWANLHVHLKPGYQHLNGYHAMGYVRIRHSDSDLMRAERQHEFLEAMRKKVKSPDTLFNIKNILDALTDDVKSDLTTDQLITLTNFARNLPKEKIQLATLPSFEGPSYVYVNVPEAEKVIRKMFYNDEMVAVNINVPDRSEVHGPLRRLYAMNRTGRRRHGRRWSVTAPNPDTSEPSLTNPDDTILDPISQTENPMPDSSGSSPATGSDTTSGGSGTGTDKSGDPGKSDPGTGTDGGSHDKGGDPGSGGNGSGGTDKTGDGGSGGDGSGTG